MCRCMIIVVAALTILRSAAAEVPSALELLDKYAQNRDKMQSFIHKVEYTAEGGFVPLGKEDLWKGVYFGKSDVRFDGSRTSIASTLWGQPRPGPYVTKEGAMYGRDLWDGEAVYYYTYKYDAPTPGTLHFNPSGSVGPEAKSAMARRMLTQNAGSYSFLAGYYYAQPERIDAVLRKAEALSVRDTMDDVAGSDCYVIEARIKDSEYRLWIDPEHGHNIARAEINRGPEDLPGFKSYSLSLENVRFREVDGVWLPVQMDTDTRFVRHNGELDISDLHIKVTEAVLDPDHEALGSFVVAEGEIKEGADVVNHANLGLRYVWKDGRPVPRIDEMIVEELDRMTDEIMTDDIKATEVASEGISVSDLLKRYRAAQEKLKSFVARAESTTEVVDTAGSPQKPEQRLCEFRFDGRRVCHRSSCWDDVAATKDNPNYQSFLWNGKSFIQYQQAAEPQNNLVSIAKDADRKKHMIATEYKGAALMGILGGDYERVDEVLAKADSIGLREKTEQIVGSDCYVIDGATKRGKYTLWIDPRHGYNIAKASIERTKGSLIYDSQRVRTGASFSLENVKFEAIGGVWVPMEADMQRRRDSHAGLTKWHHKRLEMLLNPDHEARGSFVADDIPEGTKVLLAGAPSVQYKWQNGKAVGKEGSDVNF